jgi:uncharacterized protein (UPF0276 family)
LKFALNYSPQALDLIRAGRIKVDLIKCPDWPDLIDKARAEFPVYIHFPLVAGWHNLAEVGLDHVSTLLARSETAYVNSHLGARFSDLRDPEDTDHAIETMLRDVWPLVECFGADRVILENVPYPDFYRDKPAVVSDPVVIRQVIERSGCGLLLDLAHATLSAESMQMDVYDYIEQLPLERLRELHVTGVGLNRVGFREDHLPMTEADWSLFEWAMEKIHSGAWASPWVVACEYGGIGPLFDWRSESAVIAGEIPRMYALVHQGD